MRYGQLQNRSTEIHLLDDSQDPYVASLAKRDDWAEFRVPWVLARDKDVVRVTVQAMRRPGIKGWDIVSAALVSR